MIQQLSIFDNVTNWLNIDNKWLLDYLNRHYPELKFQYDGYDIEQTRYKGVMLSLSVGTTEYMDIWENPVLIFLHVQKLKKTFEGYGLAVNNMEDFEYQIGEFITKLYEYRETINKK